MKKSLFFNHFHFITLLLLFLSVKNTLAQSQPSYRGLAIINDSMAVVSGSQGKVFICKNGSELMTDISPNGYTKKDFRDVNVHKKTITVMSSGDSAVILQTNDMGKNWFPVFTDNSKGIFLDAIEIHPLSGAGICMGDPMPNSYFRGNPAFNEKDSFFAAFVTPNFGKQWYPIPRGIWNKANSKLKSMFAASGSSIKCSQLNVFPSLNNPFKIPKNKEKSYNLDTSHKLKELIVTMEFFFAGGGIDGNEIRKCKLRVSLVLDTQDSTKYYTELVSSEMKSVPINLPKGEGWGIYCLDTYQEGPLETYHEGPELHVVASGGNWKYPDSTTTCTFNIPMSMFSSSSAKPIGYLSFNTKYTSGICVLPDNKTLVTCGTNGLKKIALNPHNRGTLNIKEYSFDNKFKNGSHLNAVAHSENFLWIVGSKNQVYRFPLK